MARVEIEYLRSLERVRLGLDEQASNEEGTAYLHRRP